MAKVQAQVLMGVMEGEEEGAAAAFSNPRAGND